MIEMGEGTTPDAAARGGEPDAGLRLAALVRGEDAARRHAVAASRIFNLAAEWGPESGLDITVQAAKSGGGTRIHVRPLGAVPPNWRDDVRWGLSEIAATAAARSPSDATAPPHLLELRMTRDLPEARLREMAEPEVPHGLGGSDTLTSELDRLRGVRIASPWPQGHAALLADLFRLDVRGLVVRYRLAGASDVERVMLDEALERSLPDARGPRHEYLGPALRVRTLVGAQEPLPARLRATLRQWASGITPVPVSGADRQRAWSGGIDALAGLAMPVVAAAAIVRLPVCGEEGFPGIATQEAPVRVRPLDPVPPKPLLPVRLGKARSAAGSSVDAAIDRDDLVHHAFVQGSTGSGKSTMLVSLALAIQAAGGSYTLLDPEGSTVEALALRTSDRHAGGTRIVRHGVEGLDVPVNIFSGAIESDVMIELFAEMIQHAFDPVGRGIVGPRWRRWFALVANGASKLMGDEATLVSVAAIASDMDRVRKLGKRLKDIDPEISHRILSEYGRLSADSSGDVTSWAASKFQPLLSSRATRWILGSSGPGLDVLDLMESGTSLAVDLGMHRLGTTGARIVGALWLLKYWAALHERRQRDRPHIILVDEAHLFQYGALPQLLAQARKFGVGVVLATQHIGQLTGELADALESNTGTFLCLRAGLQSAVRASSRLEGWPIEDLVRLPKLTAAASISRNGVVSAPFTLTIDHYELLRRLHRSGTIGEDVAAAIIAASRRAAAVASRGRPPLTETDITDLLADPPAAPKPPAPDPGDPANTLLDDWLARNKRAPAPDGPRIVPAAV